MEQFEQLLTCAICLDRYRNPKLLPCQHSFCMEPCLEGLVDYVRRQIKCPECRAEHRIPYNGVQGFPTNVTLQRFLELHIEITGELPDPTSGQIMERCNVCSEKAYCSFCSHCDKKICEECKGAHMEILRREISRINNQIRRGIHRLQDTLTLVEKNAQSMQSNCLSVGEEVEEIYRRLNKALKDRTEYLRGELDRYLGTELRSLTTLKENLEQEVSNILSNCDLADKHMNENVDIWDDCELMDAKEIFLKTVEFIRNFEYENTDYSRKVRLILAHDPNQLVLHVAGFGELNLPTQSHFGQSSGLLQPPGPGLMRSKSDHRLASQFRQQEERGYGDRSYGDEDQVLSGRKFGERPKSTGDSRYGRGDYGDDYDHDSRPTRSKYSRFRRHQPTDNDSDTEQTSRVRFNEHKEREKAFDTEDASRGPLSGITRLADSPRVMKKMQEWETGKLKKKEEAPPPAPTQPKVVPKRPPPPAVRQVSEEDEISRIKKQNKGATTSTENTTETARSAAEERQRKTPAPEAASSAEESEESLSSLQQSQRKTPTKATVPVTTRRPSDAGHKKSTRSASSDSNTSSESSTSSSAVRNTGASFTTDEVKKKILSKVEPTNTSKKVSSPVQNKPFQSRFLQNKNTTTPKEKEEETETSSEEEEETETEEEETDEDTQKNDNKELAKSDIGPLLARSANARDNSVESTRRKSRDEAESPIKTRYGVTKDEPSKYTRSRTATVVEDETPRYTRSRTSTVAEEEPSRYGYTSRFLSKSKSSAAIPPEDDDYNSSRYGSAADDIDSKYPASGRSRYMALKERRQRLARSKSSQQFGDEDDTEEPVSPTTSNPSAYLASKGYGSSSSAHDLARSRSSHTLKSRDNSPDRSTASAAEKDGAALSSWARYLKSKYGNRSGAKDKDVTSSGSTPSASSSGAARRLSLGLPLRSSTELASSDDDSKNMQGSPTTPTAAMAVAGIAQAVAGTTPKSQYLQKCEQLFQIGSRGSEAGCFTWPRGVAVGPDNTIVVADSSNHRVQVFDANGRFIKEFGQYGNKEGEFDCLAGVAVNRIGQYIIADRYNHRIQVFDPSGRFLRAFGSQGSADGRFNYPWGITTDALGFIYVCDKENHRVQVFQSDGTFVGKFGSMGNKEGQLEHPHYIAVSNTNRVVVSDSNNHRIQIFDVNGKVLTSFGSEGSEEGQFKFPRGVAVDDQGYICVADSGNNRIQIFNPDGSFLKAFGCWGISKGEFKGLEGVAMTSNGHILVCDRENHRIQVF
ncbi:RING finger protein nhl-1 isoform X1 [Diorhabda carinulata]|uniref:RING finger protein nhl-1 isoform X1 n=1 Tax=Diorhabda carinulata TaxID=1163345 RepID=UPI0025A1E2F7|nr:RING finger protein nhl-1 isoform X1 [Diorhabda carinulata]XP_057656092.1 RING finger protein nhl-1 isoform X1 [Diorhabda carinulata]